MNALFHQVSKNGKSPFSGKEHSCASTDATKREEKETRVQQNKVHEAEFMRNDFLAERFKGSSELKQGNKRR